MGCLTESIRTSRSKSNMLTPKTNSQTCWSKEILHGMSWTIFFVCLLNIINFPVFSCSNLCKVLSDPIREQCAMSEKVQESNLKEGLAVAKPKPMNLNLLSMRKILSQQVTDPNSPGNQSLDQSRVLVRSGKQSSQKVEVHPFGRQKPAFHSMQISDSRYLEKVCKNRKKKDNLAENAPPLGDPSTQNQHINLVNAYVSIREGSDFYIERLMQDQILFEILEVCKNKNFEELRNLFDITQMLVHKQGEILNVKMIQCASPSWTRSSLAHDQAIESSKAKVRVYSDSVLCLGKKTDLADANRRWEGQVEDFQQTDSYRELYGIDGESIEFEWHISQDVGHWKSSEFGMFRFMFYRWYSDVLHTIDFLLFITFDTKTKYMTTVQ